ncbi:hypothetical protein ACU686_23445 [Yinghuangia aomiensis]
MLRGDPRAPVPPGPDRRHPARRGVPPHYVVQDSHYPARLRPRARGLLPPRRLDEDAVPPGSPLDAARAIAAEQADARGLLSRVRDFRRRLRSSQSGAVARCPRVHQPPALRLAHGGSFRRRPQRECLPPAGSTPGSARRRLEKSSPQPDCTRTGFPPYGDEAFQQDRGGRAGARPAASAQDLGAA